MSPLLLGVPMFRTDVRRRTEMSEFSWSYEYLVGACVRKEAGFRDVMWSSEVTLPRRGRARKALQLRRKV